MFTEEFRNHLSGSENKQDWIDMFVIRMNKMVDEEPNPHIWLCMTGFLYPSHEDPDAINLVEIEETNEITRYLTVQFLMKPQWATAVLEGLNKCVVYSESKSYSWPWTTGTTTVFNTWAAPADDLVEGVDYKWAMHIADVLEDIVKFSDGWKQTKDAEYRKFVVDMILEHGGL